MKKQLFLIIFILNIFSIEVIAQNPTLTWVKQFGGTSSTDQGNSVKVDGLGNVYTVGNFQATTDFDPGAGTFTLASVGSNDVFVSKLDATGAFVWAKQLGGTASEFGSSIAIDASGNVYTTGYFAGTADFDPGIGTFTLTSVGSNDVFISKLDAAGNFMWAKQLGGIGIDYGFSITNDILGNIYSTGDFSGTADFDPSIATFTLTSAGGFDIYISKLDATGNFVWAKQIGGTSNDQGMGISLDASANVYTTGYFTGTADFDHGVGTNTLTSSGNDIFVLKLDANGNFGWAKQLGGNANDQGLSIAVDGSTNVYTTGYFSGTADFDPGTGIFNLVCTFATPDIFVSKLDATGNFLWAKQMGASGGSFPDVGYGISLDASANVYTTGYFSGTADFDPSVGTFTLTSAGSNEIFVSKLDALGNFVWAEQLGGTSIDMGYGITNDASGGVYITGYFQGTADFDPSIGTYTLTPGAGGWDVFVHKMSQAPLSVKEINFVDNCKVYPNPFNNKITIISKDIKQPVLIFNTLGVLLYNEKIKNEKTEIDLSDLAAGIYFIKIGSETKKVIKE